MNLYACNIIVQNDRNIKLVGSQGILSFQILAQGRVIPVLNHHRNNHCKTVLKNSVHGMALRWPFLVHYSILVTETQSPQVSEVLQRAPNFNYKCNPIFLSVLLCIHAWLNGGQEEQRQSQSRNGSRVGVEACLHPTFQTCCWSSSQK